MNNSFLSKDELQVIGFKSIGENVLISRKASFYGVENITIGNNVRIDDFCILSGKIDIASNIHISAYCALYGGTAGIFIKDYSGISARNTIFAVTDDFSGEFLVGVMISPEYRKIISGPVIIEKYVQLGAGCVVLPNVVIQEGAAVGAMSLINKSLPAWKIYAGIPARQIKERKQNILYLKDKLL